MPQTILVAEDDRAFTRMLTRVIEGAGYACTVVADGPSALKSIQRAKPDLLLLDLLLPGKDGRAVMQTMQSEATSRDIPVLCMSGVFRGRATARELEDLGAQGFLEKPFSGNELVAHLHALVGPPSAQSERPGDAVDLGEQTVAEILWQAMSEGFSGAIQFSSGKRRKVVVLEDGVPRRVRSNVARECLGRRLLAAGRVDQATLDESLRRSRADGQRQGEVLVKLGVIESQEVDEELRRQAADKLLDLFGWDEGEAWRQAGVLRVGYTSELEDWAPKAVILHGVARMNASRALARLEPLLDTRLAREESETDSLEAEAPGVAQALAALGGETSVADLVESHGRALFGLWLVGELRIEKAAAGEEEASLDAPERAAVDVKPSPANERGAGSEAAEAPASRPAEQQPSPGEAQAVAALRETLGELREKNFFALLGVNESSGTGEVRNAFLERAKRYHPDRFRDSEATRAVASEIFALLSSAHETLCDPAERRSYVQRLKSGSSEQEDRKRVRRILDAEQKFTDGEAHVRARRYDQALQCFREALELHPEPDFHAHFGYTLFLTKRGDPAATRNARQHLEQAIELAPKSPTAYYLMGQLHKACNDPELAKRMFRTVLELRPNHVEANRELRLMRMRETKGGASRGSIFGLGKKRK